MKKGSSVVTTFLVGVAFSLTFFVTPLKAQFKHLFTVNTTSDAVVANACVNAAAGCSLRGAMLAANSLGPSVIAFAIPASDPFCSAGACTIHLASALPVINVNTEFDGPGADKLTIKPVTGGQFRVFTDNTEEIVTFFGLTISNGIALGGDGGGIGVAAPVNGNLNIINCTISGNEARGLGYGGGIFGGVNGTINITNSTISGNSCTTRPGGGISSYGTLNVTNSTISGNSSGNSSGGSACSGGGIFHSPPPSFPMNITNSTITGNVANESGGGGGICNTSGVANVKNSIIALNTSVGAGPDVIGNFVSAGFNLIGKTDGSAGFTAATDLTGTIASPLDPGLDPVGLQNNGGVTKTIALIFGSPAIDKGTSNSLTGTLTTDQRGSGFMRTVDKPAIADATGGDGTDIGSFELGALISGTVTYGNAIGAPTPRFVSNVTITAAGSPTVMTTTAAPGPNAGHYSLTGFGTGSYAITPTKTGGVNGITSFDAGKIAQHVAGISTLTGNALLVADVSGNGIVSSFDAGQIAAFVSSGSGMQTGTWKFFPVNRTYSSITSDVIGEDYTALLMGEVSGNWTNTGARPTNGFNPSALSWLLCSGF